MADNTGVAHGKIAKRDGAGRPLQPVEGPSKLDRVSLEAQGSECCWKLSSVPPQDYWELQVYYPNLSFSSTSFFNFQFHQYDAIQLLT